MRKLVRIALLAAALTTLLAISAFAASGVTVNGSSNWTYTARLEESDHSGLNIARNDMYLLLVIKTSSLGEGGTFPASLTADDILYIDQVTATADDEADNSVTFPTFIPMSYSGGTAFVTGGGLSGPTAIGTLASQGVLGDVNGDNTVNLTDVSKVRDHILKRSLLAGMNLDMADVAGNDGVVNLTDLSKVRDYILKRITSLA